jgi:hypothetical protein
MESDGRDCSHSSKGMVATIKLPKLPLCMFHGFDQGQLLP